MNAEALIPPLPGDRVRASKPTWYVNENPILAAFTASIRRGSIYHVRDSYVDQVTGEPRLRLVGVFSIVGEDGQEFGFPATWFTRVSHRLPAFKPSEEDRCYVPVKLPVDVFRELEGNQVFPLVQEFVTYEDGKLEKLCRRWENKWHVSKTLRDMHGEIARAVEAGPFVVYQVPLTGYGLQDLAEICHRLGIETEAWLQGVLGNLARRFTRLHEQYAQAKRSNQKRRSKER